MNKTNLIISEVVENNLHEFSKLCGRCAEDIMFSMGAMGDQYLIAKQNDKPVGYATITFNKNHKAAFISFRKEESVALPLYKRLVETLLCEAEKIADKEGCVVIYDYNGLENISTTNEGEILNEVFCEKGYSLEKLFNDSSSRKTLYGKCLGNADFKPYLSEGVWGMGFES